MPLVSENEQQAMRERWKKSPRNRRQTAEFQPQPDNCPVCFYPEQLERCPVCLTVWGYDDVGRSIEDVRREFHERVKRLNIAESNARQATVARLTHEPEGLLIDCGNGAYIVNCPRCRKQHGLAASEVEKLHWSMPCGAVITPNRKRYLDPSAYARPAQAATVTHAVIPPSPQWETVVRQAVQMFVKQPNIASVQAASQTYQQARRGGYVGTLDEWTATVEATARKQGVR